MRILQIFTLLTVGLMFPPSAMAFTRSAAQQYVEQLAAGEFRDAMLGVLAVSADGDTLVCWNSDKLMLPASNMKLVSTGLALHSLGSDFVYRTGLARSGPVIDGVLCGDLYIVGGGDPTFASDDSIVPPVETVFSQWLDILQEAGIQRIEGRIVGDDRYFGVMPEVASWQWDDLGTYYGTGVSGLSFFENMQTFTVTSSEDKPSISVSYPACPWMTFDFSKCTTGPAGTGDRLYYYTSRFAPFGEIRGTYAVDRGTKKLECSNKFPAYTCAWYFSEYLAAHGVECLGGPADIGLFAGEASGCGAAESGADSLSCSVTELMALGSTASPSLEVIARETNFISNNLYAETLFLTLGKVLLGDDALAAQAVSQALTQLGVPHSSVTIADGSGLSRQNLLSPSFLCAFLEAMKASPAFEEFFSSLPSPGSTGTMKNVMPGYDSEVTSRIFLKSGSMTGVKCFSGYITASAGQSADAAVFSIMVNNSKLTQARMQRLTDRILWFLAAEEQILTAPTSSANTVNNDGGRTSRQGYGDAVNVATMYGRQ